MANAQVWPSGIPHTLDLPGPTWLQLDQLGPTWLQLELPGFNLTYLALPGPTWPYLALPGFTSATNPYIWTSSYNEQQTNRRHNSQVRQTPTFGHKVATNNIQTDDIIHTCFTAKMW